MKKIIVIDDDESILEATRLILEEEGYVVETSLTGNVYKMIEKFLPDAILLDVLLSGEDGREISKKLKKNPKTANIPIIMVSAHPSAVKDLDSYGANDFIAKPFEISTLLSKVSEVLVKQKN